MRFGLSYKIGKHGRVYIPVGGKSKKKQNSKSDDGGTKLLGLLGWVGIVLFLGGIGGLRAGKPGAGILLILLGVLLVFRRLIVRVVDKLLDAKSEKPERELADREAVPPPASPTPAKARMFDYEYTAVGLYRPDGAVGPMPELGTALLLELEPENAYDEEAVKAVDIKDGESVTVGYMTRGRLRDMVSDFLRRGDIICTKVTRADDKLEIWIGMDK